MIMQVHKNKLNLQKMTNIVSVLGTLVVLCICVKYNIGQTFPEFFFTPVGAPPVGQIYYSIPKPNFLAESSSLCQLQQYS